MTTIFSEPIMAAMRLLPAPLFFICAALSGAFAAGGAAQRGASSADVGPPPDVIVTGVRDILVNGRAIGCTRRTGDPLDKVSVAPAIEGRRQSEIVRDGRGGYVFRQIDEDSWSGSTFWTRTGTGIDQYVFRDPGDGRPMCIGASAPNRHTWGQYRRIIDATPFRGKRVRFTAWAATGDVELARFWLAAGLGSRRQYGGGDTRAQPWGGNHGWTPILIEIGPISPKADHLSYGFLLYGHGNLWVYKPELTAVPADDPSARRGDVAIIGQSAVIDRRH